MTTADVVIIGGGVVGASVAYHLAVRGCRDIVILEKGGRAGEGSTGKATGGFRSQFATGINVRLSLLSRDKLRQFRDEPGADPGYRPCGYLFVAGNDEQLQALGRALRIQRESGLGEAHEVGMDDILRLNPAVSPAGLVGGAFCPTDGFIRPMQILNGYLDGARRLGATLEYGVETRSFEIRESASGSGRSIVGVCTPNGTIAAGKVVNAAGAWAALVSRQAHLDLPVYPERRQVAVTVRTGALPEEMPMTVFIEDGFHLRVRDARVLLLWPGEPVAGDPFTTVFDPAWLEGVLSRARLRIPLLEKTEIDLGQCIAGLYEMSPDKHALLGLAPGYDNFYLVNGSSGHGVMHAPALGHLLAELITDGSIHTLDARALRPTRFAEGRPNECADFL